MTQELTYTTREIAMAKLKIKCSWGVAVLGLVLPTIAVGFRFWSNPLDAIFRTLSLAYYFWCLFWIIEGSLGPFLKRRAGILIPALAINLPTMGCMGCFIMIVLFPIGILAAFIIAVFVSFILMGTALVSIFWGCFGGGIYYYRKCRRIAVSVFVEPPPVAAEWYAMIEGQQVGPLTMAGLRDEIIRRGAEGTASVAKAGDADWTPFAESPVSQGLAPGGYQHE